MNEIEEAIASLEDEKLLALMTRIADFLEGILWCFGIVLLLLFLIALMLALQAGGAL